MHNRTNTMYVVTLKNMCNSVTGVTLWNTLDNSLISFKMFIISKSVIQIDYCVRVLDYFANINWLLLLGVLFLFLYILWRMGRHMQCIQRNVSIKHSGCFLLSRCFFFFNKCHNIFFSIECRTAIHVNNVVAPSIALFRCYMYVIKQL